VLNFEGFSDAPHGESTCECIEHAVRRTNRRISEAVGGLHQDEGRAFDQAMIFQKPINAGFRHKAGLGVGEVDGQFARRQIRLIKGRG
jgi:hypothetical protein